MLLIQIIFICRFYHFGCDKPDSFDEFGQPVVVEKSKFEQSTTATTTENEFKINDEEQQQQQPSNSDEFESFSIENMTTSNEEPSLVLVTPPTVIDEGTMKNHSKHCFLKTEKDFALKRSDSALNIFDQTTVLKLFSDKNWNEIFFKRLNKRFLIISSADDKLVNLPALPQQQKPQLNIQKHTLPLPLPAIKSTLNGLFLFLLHDTSKHK